MIKIRKIKAKDKNDMFEYASDKNITKNLRWEAHKNLKETEKVIRIMKKSKDMIFSIILKRKMIGTITIFVAKNEKAEVGYVINPKFQNKGFATSALGIIIKKVTKISNITLLFAFIDDKNVPSKKVLLKNNFKYSREINNKLEYFLNL